MEKAKSELAKADVEYIDQNIAYLKEHEEDMLGDLSCLINLVTLLPICETEYAEEAQTFRNYDYVFEAFNRLEECLETFDMQLRCCCRRMFTNITVSEKANLSSSGTRIPKTRE